MNPYVNIFNLTEEENISVKKIRTELMSINMEIQREELFRFFIVNKKDHFKTIQALKN